MIQSYTVSIDRSVAPIFPAICISCCQPNHGLTLRVSTGTAGFSPANVFKRYHAEIPVCGNCRNGIVWNRRARVITAMISIAAGIVIGMALLEGSNAWYKRWLIMGIGLVALAPVFVWQLISPPAIELTAWKSRVDLEFKSREFASEFAELNSLEVQAP